MPKDPLTTGEIILKSGGLGLKMSDGTVVIDGDGNVEAPVTPDSVGLTHNHILVGDVSDLGADVAMSGDATIVASGALTIANNAVTGAKTASSAGMASSTGFIKKFALVVYDFAINGGTIGPITLPTASIPDKAVVQVDSYDVLTTLTSSTDAATVKVGLATDGDLTTAIAISNGSNPWDAGAYSRIAGGLATPLTKKTTGARAVVLTVAVENVTAGKIVFNLSYWVSQ